jgi:hypothetical protein
MNNIGRIAEFFYANPSGFSHLVDLPYRPSSRSLDDPDNIHLWEVGGEIQAVGILQMPWVALDYAYQPSAAHLVPEIFE